MRLDVYVHLAPSPTLDSILQLWQGLANARDLAALQGVSDAITALKAKASGISTAPPQPKNQTTRE